MIDPTCAIKIYLALSVLFAAATTIRIAQDDNSSEDEAYLVAFFSVVFGAVWPVVVLCIPFVTLFRLTKRFLIQDSPEE